MDACYEDCKPGEAQPGACNLSCTTDKICGLPIRLSYGQFLDFQVEMLAANANRLPEQQKALPESRRRPQHHRLPGAKAKPAAGQPGAVPAETGAAGNRSWPHFSWPRF
jgi:hypothetical protein